MDFRVVHPIPLTMADVMGQFHVLDALRDGQGCGADGPAERAAAAGDDKLRSAVEASLKRDGTQDVYPVPSTPRILNGS
jgi:hypothetical protein